MLFHRWFSAESMQQKLVYKVQSEKKQRERNHKLKIFGSDVRLTTLHLTDEGFMFDIAQR